MASAIRFSLGEKFCWAYRSLALLQLGGPECPLDIRSLEAVPMSPPRLGSCLVRKKGKRKVYPLGRPVGVVSLLMWSDAFAGGVFGIVGAAPPGVGTKGLLEASGGGCSGVHPPLSRRASQIRRASAFFLDGQYQWGKGLFRWRVSFHEGVYQSVFPDRTSVLTLSRASRAALSTSHGRMWTLQPHLVFVHWRTLVGCGEPEGA